jgi:hypothetical protein
VPAAAAARAAAALRFAAAFASAADRAAAASAVKCLSQAVLSALEIMSCLLITTRRGLEPIHRGTCAQARQRSDAHQHSSLRAQLDAPALEQLNLFGGVKLKELLITILKL